MDKQKFAQYMGIFLEENSKLNLISKNDETFLWEKHICDSLAIEEFFNKFGIDNLKGKTLLDIGTGGGFPSIPIAINYPELKITALDSIGKKIRAINEMKSQLELENLETICDRAENIEGKHFDFVVSRAVAALKKLLPYAIPLIKKDGFFVAYKSLKAQEEITEAQDVLSECRAKVVEVIEYSLPLKENYTRNLIVIKKF